MSLLVGFDVIAQELDWFLLVGLAEGDPIRRGVFAAGEVWPTHGGNAPIRVVSEARGSFRCRFS